MRKISNTAGYYSGKNSKEEIYGKETKFMAV